MLGRQKQYVVHVSNRCRTTKQTYLTWGKMHQNLCKLLYSFINKKLQPKISLEYELHGYVWFCSTDLLTHDINQHLINSTTVAFLHGRLFHLLFWIKKPWGITECLIRLAWGFRLGGHKFFGEKIQNSKIMVGTSIKLYLIVWKGLCPSVCHALGSSNLQLTWKLIRLLNSVKKWNHS